MERSCRVSFALCHSPDAVEDGAVREDADVEVGLQNCVEGTNLLVSEESVRHPDFTRVCHRQIPNTIYNEEEYTVNIKHINCVRERDKLLHEIIDDFN